VASAKAVRDMFAAIAGRYDLINSVLSFGIHKIWKSRLLKYANQYQSKISVDLCTGTGDLLPGLAAKSERVIGLDFCADMLTHAKPKIRHLKNVELLEGDALQLPFSDQSVDLITVAFGVRNFENLGRGLKEIERVLRPGGHLLVLEFGQPNNFIFKQIYNFYSAIFLPIIGWLLVGNASAYRYLRETAGSFPCREAFLQQLQAAGLENAHYKSQTGGIAYIYSAQTLIEK
jgi:demethylmenaquinone methyltransferase/2-methoxy-6-polyprenyl-1,4-benzoquinol methylase